MAEASLSELMNIMFDMKEKIPEGDYLKVCNLLKTVHEDKTEKEIYEITVMTNTTEITGELEKDFWMSISNKFETLERQIVSLKEENEKLESDFAIKEDQYNWMEREYQQTKIENTRMKMSLGRVPSVSPLTDKVDCKYCGSMLAPSSIKKHHKSKKCQRARRRARRIR